MKIILTTINAKYPHLAIGLRSLLANLGQYAQHTRSVEFTLQQTTDQMVETLLKDNPTHIGLGVYIWNHKASLELIKALKKKDPKLTVIAGGPEVSFEYETLEITDHVDHIIIGEGELALKTLFEDIDRGILAKKFYDIPIKDLTSLELPYSLFSDHDLKYRLTYLESSRGCPFHCEFCLSSIKNPELRRVRPFHLNSFLQQLENLIRRGATRLKFIDRTFNAQGTHSLQILDLILSLLKEGFHFSSHFEVVPDHLPDLLKEKLIQFPKNTLQLEVGIQTFNPSVAERISRVQNYSKTVENMLWLRKETQAHIHADLIIGLPGENHESIASSFNQLAQLNPHDIQLGILKRLKGTPINRHRTEFQLVFDDEAPFEIKQTSTLSHAEITELKRFARYWELLVNRDELIEPIDWPFERFMRLSQWLWNRWQRAHALPKAERASALAEYLQQEHK